jgi:hypothetical protein
MWFVIPDLIGNPELEKNWNWIPAGVYPVLCYGAGMTGATRAKEYDFCVTN